VIAGATVALLFLVLGAQEIRRAYRPSSSRRVVVVGELLLVALVFVLCSIRLRQIM
jgi:hypothetical protein